LNVVIQSFGRLTLVDTVTKNDKFIHKIGHNTACNGDNMYAILSLWGVFVVGGFKCASESDSYQPLLLLLL